MTEAVGLSVGASMFAGVQSGRSAATRHSVLTLYGHRPPELGVPSENPHLDERGMVVTGFVDRAGDPVGMIAGDGSVHRGEVLVADALRAMRATVTGGQPCHRPVTVAYPAHWRQGAVDALSKALTRGAPPVTLISDATAACTALQSERGLPARGVIALCDFGGTGTSVTLLDAAEGYRPIAPTLRHTDFSGDLIDQALLTHVITDLSPAPSADITGTSALGQLNRLRALCRGAKERLSATTVTALTVDIPGFRGEVRLTRAELDDEIRAPLAEFVAVLHKTLDRNGIRGLAALASVGGGANIPVITTTLSEHFRVPVITAPRPELAAAKGASVRAGRGPADDKPTAMAPAVGLVAAGLVAADAVPQSSSYRGLAWSEAHEIPPLAPAVEAYDVPDDNAPAGGLSSVRPQVRFVKADEPESVAQRPRYRRPGTLAGIAAGVILLAAAIAVVAYADHGESTAIPARTAPAAPLAPPVQAAPPPPIGSPAPPPEPQAPPARTVVVAPPPITQARAPAPQPAPAAPVPSPPPPAAAPPPAEPPPADPPPAEPPPADPPPAPPVFTIPTIPPIPGVPFVFPPQNG